MSAAGRRPRPLHDALFANRRLMLMGLAFSAAMSLLALTTSFYMLQVYDRVLTSRSAETLALLTIIAAVAIAVFSWLDSLRLRLMQRIALRTADALGRKILRAMVAAASQTGGALSRNGLRDLETVKNFIGSPAVNTLMDAPFTLVFLVVLALLHWLLLVVVLIGGAILVGLAWAGQRLTNPSLIQAIELQARTHNFAEDALRNADVLEGMGMSATFVERWHAQWIASMRKGTLSADRDSKLTAMSRAVRMLIQIALLGIGAMLILNLQATGGIMIAASIIGARALAPIETGVATYKSFIAARLAWDRIEDVLNSSPRRDEGMALPAPQGRLGAARIGYLHPQSRRTILANVSFELQPGDSLGVIGPSASGKSTLARLLVGAWPCTAGSVRLDGADIYSWPRAELSRFVGYLPQDVELFAGTVRENIARMAEGDPALVVQAARLAGAHDMILQLPKGYDTELGGRGLRLSGGQAQRVGIARALYGEPKLVVLDEPNSNLDAAGEEALLATLANLKKAGVTVVIIAHRPSILAGVDKILVLKPDGTMETFGPRAEILQQFTRRPAPPPQPAQQAGRVVALATPDAGGKP
ncbi:MAG: type I secretion system permease/ATPase [Alphaproteobacteria bacterium]|nr:type I secretion system permease/ATPase [Alphaproteobacteria bacterium]